MNGVRDAPENKKRARRRGDLTERMKGGGQKVQHPVNG